MIFLLKYDENLMSPQVMEDRKKRREKKLLKKRKKEEKEKLQESLQIKGNQYSERRKTLQLQKYLF
jgi:hypothetical protein